MSNEALKTSLTTSRTVSLSERFKDDRHFVMALARGLDVLACFRSGSKMLGNQDIAQRCQLSKSTVSRLTATLVKMGYLMHDEETGKYRLGMATLSLGIGMLAQLDIRQIARPLMQELADFSQGMVTLGARDRLSMLYIENCRSRSALTLSMDVGSRIPLATTAMGRAYLAEADPNEVREITDRINELDDASKAFVDYKNLGCTCSFGDWQENVNGIAVGLKLGGSFPIMAINCGGPSFNLSPEFLLNEVRPKLLDVAQRLRETLGQLQ